MYLNLHSLIIQLANIAKQEYFNVKQDVELNHIHLIMHIIKYERFQKPDKH